MAQSVLTAIVESLSNASVTVKILALLQKYKQKFLELLRATVSTARAKDGTKVNAKEESEKILTERIEEIEQFQAIKSKVTSFVNMCDLIQPGKKSCQHFALARRLMSLTYSLLFFTVKNKINDLFLSSEYR